METLDWRAGLSTRQMLDAPKDAVFICPSVRAIDYFRLMARTINRIDLKMVSPYWLEKDGWMGLDLSGIIVDHAVILSPSQADSLRWAQTRINFRKGSVDNGESKNDQTF